MISIFKSTSDKTEAPLRSVARASRDGIEYHSLFIILLANRMSTQRRRALDLCCVTTTGLTQGVGPLASSMMSSLICR